MNKPLVNLDTALQLMEKDMLAWRIRIEFKDEKTHKFWEISPLSKEHLLTKWGKISSKGTEKKVTFKRGVARLEERLKRGYAYVEGTIKV
jgi:predicted DNA-binding WGR domain protein